ncbi:MAG: hypothetical protein LBP89_05935, partial [Helicobacteraceae bacterium]|nr:hypothetical protein [Helicobacteraceae bacterium]
MSVVSRSENRVRMESPTHAAGIRLDYDGNKKKWLMTAFEKRADPAKTTDASGRSADRIETTQLSRSQTHDETIPQNAAKSQESEPSATPTTQTPNAATDAQRVNDIISAVEPRLK